MAQPGRKEHVEPFDVLEGEEMHRCASDVSRRENGLGQLLAVWVGFGFVSFLQRDKRWPKPCFLKYEDF